MCSAFRIYSQHCSDIAAGRNKETGANNRLEKWAGVKKQSRFGFHLGTRSAAHSDSSLWIQTLIHGPSGRPEQYSCRPRFTPHFISAKAHHLNTPPTPLFSSSSFSSSCLLTTANENQMFRRKKDEDPHPSCFAGDVGQHLCMASAHTHLDRKFKHSSRPPSPEQQLKLIAQFWPRLVFRGEAAQLRSFGCKFSAL